MESQEEYLTLGEVAEHYRLSESSIRCWRQNAYGPRAVKVGRRLLYPVSEVLRFDAAICAGLTADTSAKAE
jgi:predicted DNA-binding transcriptional regulator AlpA